MVRRIPRSAPGGSAAAGTASAPSTMSSGHSHARARTGNCDQSRLSRTEATKSVTVFRSTITRSPIVTSPTSKCAT